MPIKSYIAIPLDGRREELVASLNSMKGCELIPADNHDLLVIVCDTTSEEEDKALYKQINALDSLQLLSMVSGFDDKINLKQK